MKPTNDPVFSKTFRTLDLLRRSLVPSGLTLPSLSSTALSTALLDDGLSLKPSVWLEDEVGDFDLEEFLVMMDDEEEEEAERDKDKDDRRSFFFSFFSAFFFCCSSWSFNCCSC